MDFSFLNPSVFFLSVATSIATWAILISLARPKWLEAGSNRYIIGLSSVHLFRYIGLVAMVPSIVDPTPFGWTPDYLAQIGFGDWIANVFAALAIVGLLRGWKLGTLFLWIFLIEGTLDTLYAGASIIPSITDQNKLNTMGWFILVAYVPGLIVTEALLWWHLLRERRV
jgi:hypothetical protein